MTFIVKYHTSFLTEQQMTFISLFTSLMSYCDDKNNWQYYFERRNLLSLDFLVKAEQNKSDNYTRDAKAFKIEVEPNILWSQNQDAIQDFLFEKHQPT